jgi:CBS domain-containing protein
VVVNPATTIEEALFKLMATRVHRVYVVDELRPVGVVALHDILQLVQDEK